ncbi:hypothetical protein [Pseudomonas putida]
MTNVIMRRVPEDLPAIVVLLANDALESPREDALIPQRSSYVEGFTAIDADPNQFLVVAALDAKVVKTLQLTFLPNISHTGAWRAPIEAVNGQLN